MWTFFSGNLEFEGGFLVKELRRKEHCVCSDCLKVVMDKFTRCVDHVLKSLQMNGNTLEGLRICFDDSDCASSSGESMLGLRLLSRKRLRNLTWISLILVAGRTKSM